MTFSLALSLLFFAFVAIGLVADTLIFGTCVYWVRRALRKPHATPGISILKPLCGVDDELEKNLENFSRIDYPAYEVVLGVKSKQDPAYPVAQAAVRRWPGKFKLFLQRGEPGMNPKVNQLITLAAEARHDILVISDSNCRVSRGYLQEIASLFEDPEVACVTNPIVGIGEKKLGSLMDNLHIGTAIGPGMVGAKAVGGRDIVVGKSMALRRADLEAMGGFEATRNHLAEDYVIGGKVSKQLRKRVAVCQLPVYNVSQNRTVKDFFGRYVRWSVIHRTAIPFPIYFSQAFLNPIPLALIGFLIAPSKSTALATGVTTAWKLALDFGTVRQFRPEPFGPMAIPAALLKDFLVFFAWCNGLFDRNVVWRGNRLRVGYGSLLTPLADEQVPAPALESANAWSKAREPGDRRVA